MPPSWSWRGDASPWLGWCFAVCFAASAPVGKAIATASSAVTASASLRMLTPKRFSPDFPAIHHYCGKLTLGRARARSSRSCVFSITKYCCVAAVMPRRSDEQAFSNGALNHAVYGGDGCGGGVSCNGESLPRAVSRRLGAAPVRSSSSAAREDRAANDDQPARPPAVRAVQNHPDRASAVADAAVAAGDRCLAVWSTGALFFASGASLALGAVVAIAAASLPNIQSLEIPKRPPSIEIVGTDGKTLVTRGEMHGAAVLIKDLPPYLPKAFIAIEDRRFYTTTASIRSGSSARWLRTSSTAAYRRAARPSRSSSPRTCSSRRSARSGASCRRPCSRSGWSASSARTRSSNSISTAFTSAPAPTASTARRCTISASRRGK